MQLLLGILMGLFLQNTQSGSQWDGLKHFGILEHGMYYNKYEDLPFVLCPGLTLARA